MKCSRRGDAARVVDCHHGCPETVGGSRRFEAVLVPDATSARPLGADAHEGRRMQMSRADGNDMGVYLFTMLGGEPFMYDQLLDFAGANKDAYFQVFSNGTLLDHDTVDELAKIGNIAPMLSLEGSPELTDKRRGVGVHDQVMEIMDYLGEAGVLFGYSCTVARNNWQAIVSDEFIDPLIAKGAMLSWHFLYMPLGRDPDTTMMLTPEERNQFRIDI